MIFSYSILRKIVQTNKIFVRYKNPPDHWSVLRKKIHPTDKALSHFDDFYKQVFDKKWPSIREGLLKKQKYVAVINNYGDNEETMSKLELQGALNVRTLFNLEKQYIREEFEKNKRNTNLEKIWKSADEIESKNATNDSEVSKNEEKRDFSLKTSLENAQIETNRLIDTKNVLSVEILQEFVPATKIKGKDDFITESDHYKMYDASSQFSVKIVPEYDIHFPENLNIYCYEMDNSTEFDSPKISSTGVHNYYLMDGGSILPVLALGIRPGDRILDVCAAPGGKSLLALQTLYPERVVSNDLSMSRMKRIKNVYKQFLYDLDERWIQPGRIRLTHFDGRFMEIDEDFDRILVDVPCTTDRHSLKENDNNIFKPSRIKERLKLPELQSELLFNALKLVRVGGTVVYSTCSLSPIQNDGVVHMTLRKAWEETNMKFIVKDLSGALLQTRSVFEFAKPGLLKYGHLVLPSESQNYGPTYFCKLEKIN